MQHVPKLPNRKRLKTRSSSSMLAQWFAFTGMMSTVGQQNRVLGQHCHHWYCNFGYKNEVKKNDANTVVGFLSSSSKANVGGSTLDLKPKAKTSKAKISTTPTGNAYCVLEISCQALLSILVEDEFTLINQ
ncbi:hypothetical protein B566_EDAN016153 [Ephemera danica]|nr:hypothetical protein B566_EDAN016153 [Ephemera danica]